MATTFSTAYGLSIACDFELPELAPAEDIAAHAPADVEVKLGRALEAGSFRVGEDDGSVDLEAGLLAWPGAGRFSLREGRQVLVEPEAGASEADLRSRLLGPVLASLLFQRGFLALHASAVALRGLDGAWGAVAFIGDSGEGKSTMAAALHARGCPLVADDLIAVPPLPSSDFPGTLAHSVAALGAEGGGRPLISPGFARLRLWPRSVAALGEEALQAAVSVGPGQHKLALRAASGFSLRALRLRCVYVLGSGDEIEVQALPPAACIFELARHSYRAARLPEPEQAAQFLRCGALAGVVPVRALRRPRDLARLDDVARAVQEDQSAGR